jgi:hypothetical protein
LHGYSQAIGMVPRAHGIADPRWWHISLKLDSRGLVSDLIPLPDGHDLQLSMDLVDHQVLLRCSDGRLRSQAMDAGLSAAEMGEWVIEQAKGFSLAGPFALEKLTTEMRANDDYDPGKVARYFRALRIVQRVFSEHRADIPGETGPIQLWPHGFDLAFECFGTRRVPSESGESGDDSPDQAAQLNLGFSPGGDQEDAYFYSNPWPFDPALLDSKLPEGAKWQVEGWEGSKLPYEWLVGDPEGPDRLRRYAQAVYELALPTISVG